MSEGQPDRISRLVAEEVLAVIFGEDLSGCPVSLDQVALPSKAFTMWRDTGAFGTLIPGLAHVTDRQLAPLDHLRRPLLPRRPARRSTRIAHESGTMLACVPPEMTPTFTVGWPSKICRRWRNLAAYSVSSKSTIRAMA